LTSEAAEGNNQGGGLVQKEFERFEAAVALTEQIDEELWR